MSRYQKYPVYKDSGVEWIGEIPEHWEVKRLKQTMRLITNKSIEETQNIALENIESWSGKYIPSDTEFEGEGINFQVGDILFGKLRPYLAKAYLAEFPGAAVGDFHVMRPNTKGLYGRYAFYLILNHGVISIINGSTFGAKMPRVSWDFMANIQLPIPPFEEQQAIASFLDMKTAQIDELISKKEELLKQLDEKSIALIIQAVTKGLDLSVPMKESGVNWIGKIPEHWTIWKVTHGFNTVGSGTTPKSDNLEYYDGDIPWVTTSELRESIIENTSQKISVDALQSHSALKIFPKESIVIAMYGATIGRLGILGIKATVNQACCVFANPVTFDPRFFYYWLLMRKPILISLSTGGGQPNLSLDDLKQIKIPIPSLQEQEAIAIFLDQATATIDLQREKITEAIERLKEYRSALITDAVTGKMDVHSYETKESFLPEQKRI